MHLLSIATEKGGFFVCMTSEKRDKLFQAAFRIHVRPSAIDTPFRQIRYTIYSSLNDRNRHVWTEFQEAEARHIGER